MFPAVLQQVFVSALVERLGPVIGAALGNVPHVAVVGSVGFILQVASSDEFRIAMLSMPLGILCNSTWAKLHGNVDFEPRCAAFHRSPCYLYPREPH